MKSNSLTLNLRNNTDQKLSLSLMQASGSAGPGASSSLGTTGTAYAYNISGDLFYDDNISIEAKIIGAENYTTYTALLSSYDAAGVVAALNTLNLGIWILDDDGVTIRTTTNDFVFGELTVTADPPEAFNFDADSTNYADFYMTVTRERTKIQVDWGDGDVEDLTPSFDGENWYVSPVHNYSGFSTYNVKVYVIPSRVTNLELGNFTPVSAISSLAELTSMTDFYLYEFASTFPLPDFPASLETLTVGMPLLTLPANLPDITTLVIETCGLTSVPLTIPDSVENLYIGDNNIIDVQYLPPNLKYLNLNDSSSLTTISATLPASLETLIVTSCVSLTSLPDLSGTSIITLSGGASAIVSLPNLPTTIEEILFNSDNALTSLPDLSAYTNLVTVWANNCSITTMGPLPSSLEDLDVQFNNLTSLPTLPAGLTILKVSGNAFGLGLPSLPATLETLYCSGCGLNSLPTLTGTALVTILAGSNNITSVPSLPSTMRELHLNNNTSLNTLPTLPDLSSLNIQFCGFTVFPDLSNSTGASVYINVRNNTNMNTLDANRIPLGCSFLDIRSAKLSTTQVSNALIRLASGTANFGEFNSTGQTPAAPPNAGGLVAKAALQARLWNVLTD